MKIKLAACVAICGIVCGSLVVQASDQVQTLISSAKIYYNGVQVESPPKILNYNNTTYVPIRFFAELLDASIGYDPVEKVVYVDHAESSPKRSADIAEASNTTFRMELYTAKTTYKQGELLNIWGNLSCLAANGISVDHSAPFIRFYIKDQDGLYVREVLTPVKQLSIFSHSDQYYRELPLGLMTNYLIEKSGIEEHEVFANEYPRPTVLPAGEYRIGAEVSYSIAGDEDTERDKLVTEIQIRIE